ncbi:WG repeat-containing protein [uncultured Maribacter sp.]|uniref:WG repeat-containing protein n=1 Tax=uncultured Maribacter sp. TaxID=431308 RepID=UPI0030EF5E7C|tara:strand:+ start:37332 stop:39053 length:1722 start_codon:yes stop_codon:yes gene_type:complete
MEKPQSFKEPFKRIYYDESWGYIDSNGDTLIPLNKYEFLNPLDKEGMILAHNEGRSGYININQDTLVDFIYEDIGLFSNGLAPAKMNGKWGHLTRSGEIMVPFEFDNEGYFYNCGLAAAKQNGKWGFIDKSGNEVIPIKYEKASFNKLDSYVCLSQNNKWGFFSCDGRKLTDFQYDRIVEGKYNEDNYTYFKNGPCLVNIDGKYGFINENFNVVIPYGKYTKPIAFDQSKRAIIETYMGFGLIDPEDRFILEPKYESIEYFPYPSERYKIRLNGLNGIFDSFANKILPIRYKSIVPNYFKFDTISKGTLILKNQNGKFGVSDYDGNILIPLEYDSIQKFQVVNGYSYSVVLRNNKYGLINWQGKEVIPIENNFIRSGRWFDYLIVENKGKFGLFTKGGKEIIPLKYDYLRPCHYDENNRFIAGINGKLGIINKEQDTIVSLEYDEISNWVEYGPKEHLVVKNGKHGLIGREGEIVVPPIYNEITVNNSKLIKVKQDELYGTINWKNEIVHPIKYEQIYWEWPYLTGKDLDTVFLKESGKYFATDTLGNILDNSVSKEFIEEKFEYLITSNNSY